MSLSIRSITRIAVISLALPLATGCVSMAGSTPEAKRASAMAMHDDVLAQATAAYPELQAAIDASPGYAVVDSGIFKTIIGHVGGYGVAVDRENDKRTYFNHSAWALGPLLEFGNGSAVLVFHDRAEFDALVAGKISWDFGADVDASFKFGDFGGDVSATTHSDGTSMYRVFQTGLGLNACVFWMSIDPIAELNE